MLDLEAIQDRLQYVGNREVRKDVKSLIAEVQRLREALETAVVMVSKPHPLTLEECDLLYEHIDSTLHPEDYNRQALEGDKRCQVTGNPVGTDTWMEGKPCECKTCQEYMEERQALEGDKCQTCGGTGVRQVSSGPGGGRYSCQMVSVPCPDCKPEGE